MQFSSNNRNVEISTKNMVKMPSKYDWEFIFYVILFLICSSFLVSFYFHEGYDKNVFCSEDIYFRNCKPCPVNSICKSGTFVCIPPLIPIRNRCEVNVSEINEKTKLLNTIAKWIASNISDSCLTSEIVHLNDITAVFGQNKHFHSIIDGLIGTEYEIMKYNF